MSVMTTLWTHFETQARFFGSRPLFIFESKQRSYSEAWSNIGKLSALLKAREIKSLSFLAANSVELAEIFIAGLISGVRMTFISETSLEREVEGALALNNPDLFLSSRVGPDFEKLRKLASGFSPRISMMSDFYDEALTSSDCCPQGFEYGEVMLSTSGSEGDPKGLVLDGALVWESACVFSEVYDVQYGYRFWNFLPMSYLGGLLNLLLIPLAGNAAVFIDSPFSSATYSRFLPTLERLQINSLWLVPTIARGLLRLLPSDTSSGAVLAKLKLVLIGTAPITREELIDVENSLGCPVYQSYGLTETTFLAVSKMSAREGENSVGQPFPGVQIRVDPETSHIWAMTPYMCKGQVRSDGSLLKFASEWFDTGDLGRLEDGKLYLLGRDRQVLKKGGQLLSLSEVESVARKFVDWGDVAAVPVDDAFYGENYVLFFESRHAPKDATELHTFLSANLSRWKLPLECLEVGQLPRTSSGKVALGVLKKSLESGDRTPSTWIRSETE